MAIRSISMAEYPVDQVDTVARFAFGTELTLSGEVFVYVKGVSSAAAGQWATYNPLTGVTVRLAGNAQGPVGIFMSTLDATTKFGWIQVVGINTIASTDTVAADKPLYIDGTAGRADDAVVAGDLIAGAFSLTADTSNVATVYLQRPFVTDTLS